MPDDLVIPAAIETVIQRFENATSPFTELDVSTALGEARRSLQSPSEEESFAAWAEVLGFALQADRTGKSPWRTFFGPTGSSTREDGKPIYYPDIADADARVIGQWRVWLSMHTWRPFLSSHTTGLGPCSARLTWLRLFAIRKEPNAPALLCC